MTTYERMKKLGWDETEARWRTEAINTSHRNALRNAATLGLQPGESVVVQFEGGTGRRPVAADCVASVDGPMLVIGGCVPSPGMVRLSEAVPLDARRLL